MQFISKVDSHRRTIYSKLKEKGFMPPEGSEVILKQLPVDINEFDILHYCDVIGPIFQIRLMMQPCGKNRGYAFVCFMNIDAAQTAIKNLPHIPLAGNRIYVQLSLNNCRIFLGGIPVNKTKDDVWRELLQNGAKHVTDVIMFRSYTERAINRGFVFVEFRNHEAAAHFRAKFSDVFMFGQRIIVDWSVPIPAVQEQVMAKVTKVFLRNLNVLQTHEELTELVRRFVPDHSLLLKVYKFKNYAFVHLANRETAEQLLQSLENYYKYSPVEVTWAKPTQKLTTPTYRQNVLNKRYQERREFGHCECHPSRSWHRNSESSSSGFYSSSSLSPLAEEFVSDSQRFVSPYGSMQNDDLVWSSSSSIMPDCTPSELLNMPILNEPLVNFEEIQEQFSEVKTRDALDDIDDAILKQSLLQILNDED